MFLAIGISSTIAPFLNLCLYKTDKDYKLARVVGLSFTLWTLVAKHSALYE